MNLKKTLLALALVLSTALPALAQAPACNEGHLRGLAEGSLNQCIAQARETYDVSFEITCDCPGSGATINVFGAPRCHPGEVCPLFLVLIGSVQVDCSGNVISATCGFQ
jgi:hypothetical protein